MRMTRRGAAILPLAVTSLLCGLSTGNRLYYMVFLTVGLCYAYGLASVLWLKATLRAEVLTDTAEARRGEQVRLQLQLRHGCLLPMSALTVEARLGGQTFSEELVLSPFRTSACTLALPARHVGVWLFEVTRVEGEDLFGLFRARKKPGAARQVLVLPRAFDIEKPTFAAGEGDKSALGRTQEDFAAPEDVRAYLPGDAMKRVHWKLSFRKRELLVRRYETPEPPDTLVLLDTSVPEGGEGEALMALRDALCETVMAVADLQLRDQSAVRVPFYGRAANEFSADGPEQVHLLERMLAMQAFDGDQPFERTLNLELRRMRRTGAVIIVTTHLNPRIVDGVSRIRRMGSNVRLYLATYTPEAPEYLPCVARLQHHLVEVLYVTPA